MSPHNPLTSQLLLEAHCPPLGQKKRPLHGAALRVVAVLYQAFNGSMTPKQIAPLAQVSHANAKKILTRNEGVWVKRTMPGFYRAYATTRLLRRIGLEPYTVHGIQCLVVSPTGGLPPRLRGLGTERRQADGEVHQRTAFHGRTVTVQAGGLVSVRATMQPFPVPEFLELCAWIEGLAIGGEVRVVKLELNVDVPDWRLRIDGASAMTLSNVKDGLWKAYQKREAAVLRFEAAPSRLSLSLGEVARVLHEFSLEQPFVPPSPDGLGPEVG